jgi:DNA-binding response OmpR family regulator
MKKNRILIVEDDYVQFLSTEMLMGIWGYEVLGPASSSEQALEIAERDKPDVILMDISIQGNMDGIETARQIAEQFKIPVIFTTGYDHWEVYQRVQTIKSAAFLVKPYDIGQLKAAIEAHTKSQ